MDQVAAGHRVQVQIPEMHLAGKKTTGTWTKKLSNESNLPMSNASEGEVFHPDLSKFFVYFHKFHPSGVMQETKRVWMLQLESQQSCTHYNPLFFRSLWENLKVWSQRHQAIGHHPVLPKLLAQFETIQQGPGVHQVVYHLLPIEYRKPISSWMISFQSSCDSSSLSSFHWR